MDEVTRGCTEEIAAAVDVAERVASMVALEQYVRAIWPEIVSLPLAQRRALLLHLEANDLLVFVSHGCCSLRQVGDLLEMAPAEFARWFRQLPLPDDCIAAQQELTRRQVINHRKRARERLSRRLRTWDVS
jgi:hypothetical protein